MRHRMSAAATALAGALALAGCFSREENLVIRPDGSVLATVTMQGDEADYLSGERLEAPSGWSASEEARVENGERQITAVWKAELPGLNRYPRSFARPGDSGAEASVLMQTSLDVEEHPDRRVYRFRRVFTGRRAGMYAALRSEMVPSGLQDKAEKDPDGLSAEERERLFAGYASYESEATLLRARNALGRAVREGVMDLESFEPTLEALRSFLKERLSEEALRSLFLLPDDEQGQAMDRLHKDIRRQMESAAPSATRAGLREILDREERIFEVSQDLTDDGFQLTVQLPGTVVEANSRDVRADQVLWQIAGSDLLEGDLVLTAVSVAAR
ncbi:MAG: hypothetical protein ACREAA_20055 [Candidatus Polarisedimenticolia bacterium]